MCVGKIEAKNSKCCFVGEDAQEIRQFFQIHIYIFAGHRMIKFVRRTTVARDFERERKKRYFWDDQNLGNKRLCLGRKRARGQKRKSSRDDLQKERSTDSSQTQVATFAK